MITTLLKHEFGRTRGLLAALFGIHLLVAVGGWAMAMTGLPGLELVGQICAVVAAATLVPVTMLALGADHWRSSFSERGYLVQSLPVPGRTQLAAKVAHGYFWTLVASMVTLLLAVLASLTVARVGGLPASAVFDEIGAMWGGLRSEVPGWVLVVALASLLVMLLGYVAMIWFAAAVGSEGRMSGTGWGPFVVYAGLYMLVQALMTVAMLVIPFGMEMDGANAFDVHAVNVVELLRADVQNVLPLGFLPVLVLLPVVLLWRTAVSWDQKVSLP
ncbi:hypothetical protein [Luteococcus sanguinis]|uniref:ABC transporter permease n=1 Tax=Luteococcus sanguinis TaxID=174038 RepID=A0ABW1X0F8_9ACTN